MNSNYNKRNPKYFCLQHVGDNFVQYCVDCKKNLCHFCTKEHVNHQRKKFDEDEGLILFENNIIKNKVEEVKEEKIKFFNVVNNLQKELNKIINDFQQKEKNYDLQYRRNYETVKGANDIMNFNFKEFISLTINKYKYDSYDLSKLSNNNEVIKNNYVPNNTEIFSIFRYNNIIKKNYNDLRIDKTFNCNIIRDRNNDNNNLNKYIFNNLSKEKNDHSNDNQNMNNNHHKHKDEKELSEVAIEESNLKDNNNHLNKIKSHNINDDNIENKDELTRLNCCGEREDNNKDKYAEHIEDNKSENVKCDDEVESGDKLRNNKIKNAKLSGKNNTKDEYIEHTENNKSINVKCNNKDENYYQSKNNSENYAKNEKYEVKKHNNNQNKYIFNSKTSISENNNEIVDDNEKMIENNNINTVITTDNNNFNNDINTIMNNQNNNEQKYGINNSDDENNKNNLEDSTHCLSEENNKK